MFWQHCYAVATCTVLLVTVVSTVIRAVTLPLLIDTLPVLTQVSSVMRSTKDCIYRDNIKSEQHL